MKGREVLRSAKRGDIDEYIRNTELKKNVISDYEYYKLSFYMGGFQKIKAVSKNPQSSLGWSGSVIRYGIRLILLYLYEDPLSSKAAAGIAGHVGFLDEGDLSLQMDFESEIMDESHRLKISMFWNYFQRWKKYFQMSQKGKNTYFAWAEKLFTVELMQSYRVSIEGIIERWQNCLL